MSSVVSDTHALLWYLGNSNNLSASALNAFDTAERNGSLIYVPAISVVELRYLVEKGRGILETDFRLVVNTLNDPNSAFTFAPLDQSTAEDIERIPRSVVPEMPDRMIAATAFNLNLPLVSKDMEIRRLQNITVIWYLKRSTLIRKKLSRPRPSST